MTPQMIAVLLSVGLATHLGILGYLVRGQMAIREDTREIKTVIGTNGGAEQGLVAEVNRLRDARHDHANKITQLLADVAALKGTA